MIKSDDGVELSTICRQLKMSAPDGKTGAVRGIKQKREPSPFSFQPETKKTTDQKPAYYEGDDPVKIFRRKYPVLFSTSPSNTRPTIYLIELELLAGRTKEIIGKSLVAVWKIAGGKKYCARLTTKTQKPGGGKQVKKFLSLKEELFLLQHRTELISE